MACYAFQSAGPASLDTAVQRLRPDITPRINWGPGAFPADGYFQLGDLHINTTTGVVYVCTTAGVAAAPNFTIVGTQA